MVAVTCREGASIGARSVCVAPVTIGRWALVAAGSVVTKDVPDFALVVGAPARRVGWVGRAGTPPASPARRPTAGSARRRGRTYTEAGGVLTEDAHEHGRRAR